MIETKSSQPAPTTTHKQRKLHALFMTPDDGRIVIGEDSTARIESTLSSRKLAAYRPRLFWRLTFWFIVTMLLATAINLALQAVANITAWEITTNSLAWQLVTSVSTLIVMTASVFLARRWFDHRSIRSLGLRWDGGAARDLLAGFLIATLMMFLMFFIGRLGGWLMVSSYAWQNPDPGQWWLSMLVMFVAFIGVGWEEELVTRGYLLHNLADSWLSTSGRVKIIMAVILTSALFGFMHMLNPNATWIGALGSGLAGIFLAYGLIASKRLWLPIGIHIGWNFIEGPILGFPVSGMTDFVPMVQQQISGPDWLTGGAFGPEAGVVLLPALVLGTILVWVYTRAGQKQP